VQTLGTNLPSEARPASGRASAKLSSERRSPEATDNDYNLVRQAVAFGGRESGSGSAMAEPSASAAATLASLAAKLAHPLLEVRERALHALAFKLDNGLLHATDVGGCIPVLRALLEWFNCEEGGAREAGPHTPRPHLSSTASRASCDRCGHYGRCADNATCGACGACASVPESPLVLHNV